MKKATPQPEIPIAELRVAVHEALARLGKPTTATALAKALPKPFQRAAPEIAALLAEGAREGSLFTVKDGKGFRYSDRDPAVVLAPAIQQALREGPLDLKQLTTRIQRAAPGFEKMLPAVLAVEVAAGAVREHPKAAKQPLRYGLEPPDPTPFLGKAVKDLQALAKKLATHGVTVASIHAALGRALGLEQRALREGASNASATEASMDVDPATDDATVRAALRELGSREPPGALLSVRALRAQSSLDKDRFDASVLRLSRARELSLHHHDFPASLPEAERALLVHDGRGVYYVGVALRDEGGQR